MLITLVTFTNRSDSGVCGDWRAGSLTSCSARGLAPATLAGRVRGPGYLMCARHGMLPTFCSHTVLPSRSTTTTFCWLKLQIMVLPFGSRLA
jgi:hypothetical protein